MALPESVVMDGYKIGVEECNKLVEAVLDSS